MSDSNSFQDSVTFVLALIGSVGTIVGWIHSFFKNKQKIKIRVVGFSKNDNMCLSYLSFSNQSRLPISILSLGIKINGTVYPCREISQSVVRHERRRGNEITHQSDEYSIAFPINLTELGSTSGYVLFVLPKGIHIPDSKELNLVVSTNRGKAIEMSLPLDQVELLI